MKRIKKFGVIQTAKISAVIYFLTSFIFVIPMSLMSSMFGDSTAMGFPMEGTFLIFLPIFYGIFGFFATAIACLIYNAVAKYTGGIEFELETE